MGFRHFSPPFFPRSSTEESASAGLAARKRRDKRVTRVATGLLQEPARDGMGWDGMGFLWFYRDKYGFI